MLGTAGYRICDVDCRWYGRAHDSRVYEWSEVKRVLENQARFRCAGDSGYAMLHVIIKPYSVNEAVGDPSKAAFNTAHSRLRTVMTENIFGQLQMRFSILRNTRTHLPFSQKIIIACCMLHNMAKKWNKEDPSNELGLVVPPEPVDRQLQNVIQQLGPLEVGGRIREQIRLALM